MPSLEQLQKEARRATRIRSTRYLTIVLAAFQSLGYAYLFKRRERFEANSGRVLNHRRHAHRRNSAAHGWAS